MKKPLTGWPKYCPSDQLHYGKLATVFIVWGVISLITAWYFNNFIEKKTYSFNTAQQYQAQAPLYLGMPENMSEKSSNVVGPINVRRRGTVYEIGLYASLPVQSWSFIEGEVLDAEKEYLYSFGKELWHETGRDSDGAWRENKNHFKMKVTFPKPGTYYLNFKTEKSRNISNINAFVSVNKKRGSALPHFWLGIFLVITGIILNEISKRTITKTLRRMSDD